MVTVLLLLQRHRFWCSQALAVASQAAHAGCKKRGRGHDGNPSPLPNGPLARALLTSDHHTPVLQTCYWTLVLRGQYLALSCRWMTWARAASGLRS